MILFIYADFGLTLALIAAGSAIASMIGSGVSSHQNRKSQERINAQQMKLAEETNQLNVNEAQKEREWNDYSTQSAHMMQAGLNPATMFGGQGSPVNSNAQANGVTPPSLGVPSFDNMYGDPSSFEQIASAINQISNANLNEQERQDLIHTAIDRYNKIANDASKSDYERAIAKIDADFYENYGLELKRNELQVVKNTANKIYNESENLVKQGKFIEAETELSKARKETEVEIKKFKGKEREALEARLKRIDELIDNEINESKSRQFANVTGAKAQMIGASAQAEDLRQTRKARIEQLKGDARLKNSLSALNEFEVDTNPSKFWTKWNKTMQVLSDGFAASKMPEVLKLQLSQADQQLKLAIKNNDWYMVNQIIENTKDIALSAGSVYLMYQGYQNSKPSIKVTGFR